MTTAEDPVRRHSRRPALLVAALLVCALLTGTGLANAASGDYIVTVASYAAQAPEGWEPTLNHEHSEYRWCTLEEALELLHWPEVKDGLRVVAARVAR